MTHDTRITAKAAGYMELAGAKKDGDCHKVRVEGGVSKELGCCNLFQPEDKDVKRFHCGECEYLKAGHPVRSLGRFLAGRK